VPKELGYHLLACGRKGLPLHIVVGAQQYRLGKVFKHDFFAATGLYEIDGRNFRNEMPVRVVLKMSRQQHFLGFPLSWLGRLLCSHEVSLLRRLSSVQGVPRLLGCYGETGFVYQYIEGRSLKNLKELPEVFFDQLLELVRQIHQKNVVYLDMNKLSNILLGADGRACLVDFQISLHLGPCMLVSKRLSEYVRQGLQKADLYHLFKHKHRLCPEGLKPHEKRLYNGVSGLVRAHRMIATPLRRLRRGSLRFLREKGVIVTEKAGRVPAGD